MISPSLSRRWIRPTPRGGRRHGGRDCWSVTGVSSRAVQVQRSLDVCPVPGDLCLVVVKQDGWAGPKQQRTRPHRFQPCSALARECGPTFARRPFHLGLARCRERDRAEDGGEEQRALPALGMSMPSNGLWSQLGSLVRETLEMSCNIFWGASRHACLLGSFRGGEVNVRNEPPLDIGAHT